MDLISARAVPERSPLDEMLDALDDESQIDRLVELFVIAPDQARARACERPIAPAQSRLLHRYAERMADLAARNSSESRLFFGVTALVIENGRLGFDPVERILVLLYDSARRITRDGEVFRRAADRARPDLARILLGFAES
jgi:hypothetical protein